MKLATCRVEVGTQGARLGPIQALGAWWVQFGDRVLIYAANSAWSNVTRRAERHGMRLEQYPRTVRKGDLHLVVQKGRLFQHEYPDVPVLLDKGRYLVVELSAEEVKRIGARREPCFVIQPLRENTVVFDVRSRPTERRAPKAWVQNLVDDVEGSGFEDTIIDLVSYPTRYSTSDHYTDAAVWAQGQLEALGYAITVESVAVGTGASRNVIGEKLGSGSGVRDLVLIVAHLDSINSSGGPSADAPGADDNGSGAVALLEIARVLSDHPAVHDLRFVLFGGEEQGLYGSTQYVGSLSAAERSRIRAVINMDMIGSLNTSVPTVLLEGAAVSQTVVDDLADAATTYTSLTVQTSLYPYASDHVPFIDAGLPAVLTIEGADGANSYIHTVGDTLDHIDLDLALEIVRMNVAVTATALEREGGTMSVLKHLVGVLTTLEAYEFWIPSRVFSGRYHYNGGASSREGLPILEAQLGSSYDALRNPIYDLDEPIYVEEAAFLEVLAQPSVVHKSFWELLKIRFTLHIDIDGADPLDVVSGTVAKGVVSIIGWLPHFIGRVTSNTFCAGGRNLVVEDFSFQWPVSTDTIDRLEIVVTRSGFAAPTADVTFIDTARSISHGPYTATRESRYFRDVEVEVDREDDAVDVEPYNTHTHPDRPADLPEEELTLYAAFAKAGIRITRSSESDVIDSSAAGAPDNRWSQAELHDAMEDHWSAFANRPQWKMWIFLAELYVDDGTGGVMFDGYIDEPGGVDRQGTAIFTLCEWFHDVTGGYITANPPEAEAVQRELFFNLVHETGHAYNLAHSWQKQAVFEPGDVAWTPPGWMPLISDDFAISWMNYPERPSAGNNATWFYDRFRFRFGDDENLFLRHAPAPYVRMGAEDWFENHARVSRGSLDRRLELVVRSRKDIVELGEPVFLELRLRNTSDEAIMAHGNLDPSDGFVEMAVTNPRGERRPFLPFIRYRRQILPHMLEPGQSLYEAVNLTMGLFGFPFKEPGPYRIEASYRNIDGSTAAAMMQLWVRPPENYEDLLVISELFNARVGRGLYVGGSHVMQDVNDKLDWVLEHLGEKHPQFHYLTAARAIPLATHYKLLKADSNKVRLLDPDPGFVEEKLAPVIENTEAAADAVGHIMYRRIVDIYTRSALDANKKAKARYAQKRLLDLFKKRGVIRPVIEGIEQRVKELK